MNKLFQQRLSKHLLKMTGYLRYVLNDFFVIALIFFAGGLGLEYSNFLKQLRPGQGWLSWIMAVIILIAIQFGRLATLVQTPDYVFLMPCDREMHSYLRCSYYYSLLNAEMIQLVIWFLMLPLFRIQFQLTWRGLISWLIMIWILKANGLLADLSQKFKNVNRVRLRLFNKLLIPVALIGLGIWRISLAAGLSLIWLVIMIINYHRSLTPVSWRQLIRSEHNRMHTIYQIFNMFVDVPNLGSSICRRRYLNPALKLIRLKSQNVYLYLYAHGFVRDKEFSDLYLRLTIIGMVILLFLNGQILPIILGIVFIYLIAFQLIPFYFHFDSNAFVHIYPLGFSHQLISFQKILKILLFSTGLLFLLMFCLAGHAWSWDLINGLIIGFEILGLVSFYVPRKIRQASR